MRRFFTILFILSLAFSLPAQNRRQATKKRPATTVRKGGTRQKTTGSNKKKTAGKKPVYTNESIKGLQNQRAAVQRKIKEQERLLRANRADVKKRLGDLMMINGDIDRHKKSIDVIQNDITHIEGNISLLKSQLSTLGQQLADRKAKYIKSMRYMAKQRSVQERLMFIFSADNFSQMYRRLRFVREYAAYQQAQGEMLKAKQQQISSKHKELENVKGQKNTLLDKGRQEHAALQDKQAEQQKVVSSLKKQQKTIESIIGEQRKKDAALNAQIDRLIAIEVAKARARAAAEAKRKAEAAAAAKKKREEELARKKAEAEAAARENARRVAEAKAREERLKAEARAAEKKSAAERERAERAAREAEANRVAAEKKAEVDKSRHEKEVARAKTRSDEALSVSSADRELNRRFADNRGRLPMPITGSYRIVSHFGQYTVEGLKNVTLDNKGINILGSAGACARAIFNGEVSAVFEYGGTKLVMVRHGNYISVYCNLRSVSVHKGQQVSTRQVLGTVGADNILQFQLRQGTAKLNPEAWLGR